MKNNGAYLSIPKAFFVSLSSKHGGIFIKYANINLSTTHWLNKLKAAIGKRRGMPIPYINVM